MEVRERGWQWRVSRCEGEETKKIEIEGRGLSELSDAQPTQWAGCSKNRRGRGGKYRNNLHLSFSLFLLSFSRYTLPSPSPSLLLSLFFSLLLPFFSFFFSLFLPLLSSFFLLFSPFFLPFLLPFFLFSPFPFYLFIKTQLTWLLENWVSGRRH